MLEAITYDSMLKDIAENGAKEDTIGILFALPKSRAGEDIIDTLRELLYV